MQAPTRDEDLFPWGDSRSTPRSMSALERNPQVPALTPHKVLGPATTGEESREAPEQLAGVWPIRSVISQSFKDYEFIIIDGGSTDNSVEIIINS